ncbi:MAG: NAD(P)H-dependent oxidoreductase subunit E [Bacteroidota bacterium]
MERPTDVSPKPAYLPTEAPERHFSDEELQFSPDEKKQIESYLKSYPERDAAVMRVLWLAQDKFGWLPPEVMKLVAQSIDMPYAKVVGVATFYTQYFKKKPGQHVLEVCTCFSCQVMGGYDILHYLEDKLGIKKGEISEDGKWQIREAECLGACGSAPMMQVTNGQYVHNLTPAKCDAVIATLEKGDVLPFESVTLPQDEDEMGGNRRSDTEAVVTYQTAPIAETTK